MTHRDISPSLKGLFSPKTRTSELHRRSSVSSTPFNLNSPRRSIRKADNLLEFVNSRTKQSLKNFRFKIRLHAYLLLTRATIDNYYEEISPGFKQTRALLQHKPRSNDDAKCILDYIRRFSFFSKFTNTFFNVEDKALIELCRRIKYEYHQPGTFVFKEGDASNGKFYIVFRGQLTAIKKEKSPSFKDQISEEFLTSYAEQASSKTLGEVETTRHRKETLRKSHFAYQTHHGTIDKIGMKLEQLTDEAGIVQHEIKRGEAFGETMLINSKAKRLTSVLANTICELIVITKNDYEEIVKKYDIGRRTKNEFMEQKIPFLGSIVSHDAWDILYNSLQDLDYCIGTTVVVERTRGKKIFFIGQGECELEKTILLNVKNERSENEVVKTKKVFATVGAGTCIGEEIIFKEDHLYLYTVKVKSSSARLYCVEKSEFLNKFPFQCVDSLKENFVRKEQLHEGQLQKIAREATEELNLEKIAKLSAKITSMNSSITTSVPTPQRIYNHMHMSQTIKNELINDKKNPLKETNHKTIELLKLFPKEESTSKVRIKVSPSPKKGGYLSAANSPSNSRKDKTLDYFNETGLINPHVALKKEKLHQMFKVPTRDSRGSKGLEVDSAVMAIVSDKRSEFSNLSKHEEEKRLIVGRPSKNTNSELDLDDTPIHSVRHFQVLSPKSINCGLVLQRPNLRRITFSQIEQAERSNSHNEAQKQLDTSPTAVGNSSRFIQSSTLYRRESLTSHGGFMHKDSSFKREHSQDAIKNNNSNNFDETKLEPLGLSPTQSSFRTLSLNKGNSASSRNFTELLKRAFPDRVINDLSNSVRGSNGSSISRKGSIDDLPPVNKQTIQKSIFVRYPRSPRDDGLFEKGKNNDLLNSAKQKRKFLAKSTGVSPDTSVMSKTMYNSREAAADRMPKVIKGWKG